MVSVNNSVRSMEHWFSNLYINREIVFHRKQTKKTEYVFLISNSYVLARTVQLAHITEKVDEGLNYIK
jgi:hypothetical protein